jgi:SnoaL-like domain
MNTNELHRMMIDALVAHDCQTMRDHYAPDYTYRGPDGEVGDVDVALGTVQMYCTAFPDLDVEDQPPVVTDRQCVGHQIHRSRHSPGRLGRAPRHRQEGHHRGLQRDRDPRRQDRQ